MYFLDSKKKSGERLVKVSRDDNRNVTQNGGATQALIH